MQAISICTGGINFRNMCLADKGVLFLAGGCLGNYGIVKEHFRKDNEKILKVFPINIE